MPNKINNLIIGAGISGLTAAYKLKGDCLLVESSDQVGGNWRSHQYKDSVYEMGPSSFMNRSEDLERLIDELSFRDNVLSHSFKESSRYLYFKNKLIPVKPGPGILFSGLFSPWDIIRAAWEPYVSKRKELKEETIDEFITRRFGKGVARNLVANALQGIWAGDSRQLSAKAAMSTLVEYEEDYGSVLKGFFAQGKGKKKKPLETCSFVGGMQDLCFRLAEEIGTENIKLSAKAEIVKYVNGEYLVRVDEEVYEAKNIIIATKAFQAAELIEVLNHRLAAKLKEIYYAPIALYAYTLPKFIFKDKAHDVMQAFGYISGKESHLTLGSIWSSQLFPERELENEYLMVSFLGGSKNPQILDFSSDDIYKTMVHEQMEVLGPMIKSISEHDFKLVNHKLITRAIPQYQLGHKELIESIETELAQMPGLKLIGNYFKGVAIGDCISSTPCIIKS